MVNEPSGTDPGERADMNEDLHIAEDPFLTETLSSLSDIRVPSEFLPNVMFRVYERHHRNSLRWREVTLTGLGLALLAVVFFILDVAAMQEADDSLSSFSAALDARLDAIITNIEGMLTAVGSVLSAGLQLMVGTVREATGTVVVALVLLVVVGWLVRKLLLSTLR